MYSQFSEVRFSSVALAIESFVSSGVYKALMLVSLRRLTDDIIKGILLCSKHVYDVLAIVTRRREEHRGSELFGYQEAGGRLPLP